MNVPDTALLAGPAWDNTTEYSSLASAEFAADERRLQELMHSIESSLQALPELFDAAKTAALKPEQRTRLISSLQDLSGQQEQVEILISNLFMFVRCEKSVDATNQDATKKLSQLSTLRSRYSEMMQPIEQFLFTCPDDLIQDYLVNQQTQAERFRLLHKRAMNDTLLSEAEEKLLRTLKTSGHSAWGDLYDAISGNLKCRLPDPDSSTGGKEIGLAQTSGYLRSGVESERHAAWTAIQHAWHEQREPCAAILNALAGWRLDLVRKRSHTRPIDFLTYPLHKNAIRRETLDAMLTAIRSKIEIPRRGLRCLARALGKSRLDPWDLLSAAPPQMGFRPLPFSEGFELVASAFEAIHPEMGEFARLMLKNSWIEARVLPNKQQGGYCTEFAKSRTPRIFQTYMGSVSDIKTLAHEIGHAYHSWVMRDLKIMERHYPATLAETASVFGETAVAAAMAQASDISMRRAIGWQVAETAAGFLINIPARFEFEKNFYELRNERFVTPDELSELTERAWQSWYGDTLAQTDRLYWASKLHFSMAGTSFYNFPYAFGYLFSVGLYARRESEGPAFFNTYKRILLDTGRMTAEDLIHKHLGEDISQPDFWLRSLELVERKIAAFEPLLT